MLKLLIVDDEPLVREGLKNVVDWATMGFEICGEAENGREGIQKVKELNPDLIIVDIRMPEIDGLDMVKIIKDEGYSGNIIMLTGYAEFNYAQRAIKYGINEYLLKPIEEEELINAVKGTREKILQNQKISDFIGEKILPFKYVIPKKIITMDLDDTVISNINMMYKMGFPWDSYQLVLVQIDKRIGDENQAEQNIIREIQAFINKDGYIYVFEENERIAMMLKDTVIRGERNYIRILKDKIDSVAKLPTELVIGTAIKDIKLIKNSYNTAMEYLHNKFYVGLDGIILEDEIISKQKEILINEDEMATTEEIIDKLYTSIVTGCSDNIEGLMDKLENIFIKEKKSEDKVKLIYVNIFARIINIIRSNYSNIDLSMFSSDVIIDEVNEKKYFRDLKKYISQLFLTITQQFVKPEHENKIDKLLGYIKANFDKNLSLEELADIFNYSRPYLGQLFKNNTGMYFNQYVDSLRIEKAKELLANGLKVYEVALQVGFSDVNYFYSKFKKYAGVSPKEFKKG